MITTITLTSKMKLDTNILRLGDHNFELSLLLLYNLKSNVPLYDLFQHICFRT